MLKIYVFRHSISYQPKRHPELPDAWDNNDYNNSKDFFQVSDETGVLFQCPVQTIANVPGFSPRQSIAPGEFQLRTFVEQRQFWPRIHGITRTKTLDDREINDESVVYNDDGRYLLHDWQFLRNSIDPDTGLTYPQGSDTRVAWSEGCFVLHDDDLEKFNLLLDAHDIGPDTYIPGVLLDQAT